MTVLNGIRGRWTQAGGALLSALFAVTAAIPVHAQNPDSIRTLKVLRAVTPFEVEVERLARELIERRNVSLALSNARQRMLITLRQGDIAEGERLTVTRSLRGLEGRLASLEGERAELRRALDQLCSQRQQPQGWVGVNFTSEYTLDKTPNGFAMTLFKAHPSIESVEPNSPAERAGIQRGDVLLTLAGRDLADAEVVFGQMLRPGARLALKLKRGVDVKTVSVLVEPRPADFEVPCAWVDETISAAMAPLPNARMRILAPGSPSRVIIREGKPRTGTLFEAGKEFGEASWARTPSAFFYSGSGSADWAAGAHIIPLNEDLARLVAVDRGLFVVEVTRRSFAAQSDLRSGDVIVEADGRQVSTPQQLLQIMEQSATKEVSLQVMRNKKTVTVVLRWSE